MSNPDLGTIERPRAFWSESHDAPHPFDLESQEDPRSGLLTVYGGSGAGKTSLAEALAEIWDGPHDYLWFGPTHWWEGVPSSSERGRVFRRFSRFHMDNQASDWAAVDGTLHVDFEAIVSLQASTFGSLVEARQGAGPLVLYARRVDEFAKARGGWTLILDHESFDVTSAAVEASGARNPGPLIEKMRLRHVRRLRYHGQPIDFASMRTIRDDAGKTVRPPAGLLISPDGQSEWVVLPERKWPTHADWQQPRAGDRVRLRDSSTAEDWWGVDRCDERFTVLTRRDPNSTEGEFTVLDYELGVQVGCGQDPGRVSDLWQEGTSGLGWSYPREARLFEACPPGTGTSEGLRADNLDLAVLGLGIDGGPVTVDPGMNRVVGGGQFRVGLGADGEPVHADRWDDLAWGVVRYLSTRWGIFGPASSGKTSLARSIATSAARSGSDVLVVDLAGGGAGYGLSEGDPELGSGVADVAAFVEAAHGPTRPLVVLGGLTSPGDTRAKELLDVLDEGRHGANILIVAERPTGWLSQELPGAIGSVFLTGQLCAEDVNEVYRGREAVPTPGAHEAVWLSARLSPGPTVFRPDIVKVSDASSAFTAARAGAGRPQ